MIKRLLITTSRDLLTLVKEKSLVFANPQLTDSVRIKSHLTVNERVYLYRLTKNKSIVIEIGSYIGASACCFGAAMKEFGTGKLFCIDTWKNDAMSEGNWDTYAEFSKNTVNFSKFITPIRGFSTEVVEQVANQTTTLDLLFIDGDHSYEGVKADWEAYQHFLKPGSIVIFHDWGWAEGVKRVIEEDVKPLVSHFDSLPNMWWGTING